MSHSTAALRISLFQVKPSLDGEWIHPSWEWSRSLLQTTGLTDTLDLHAITQGHGGFGKVEVKAPQTLINNFKFVDFTFCPVISFRFFLCMVKKSPSFDSPTAWLTGIWGVWRSVTEHNPTESRVPGGALQWGLWNNVSNGNVKEDVNARRFPGQHHYCHHYSIFTGT